MYNVKLLDEVPWQLPAKTWPIAGAQALIGHWLTTAAVAKEAAAAPPWLETLLIGLQVPVRQRTVHVMVLAELVGLAHPLFSYSQIPASRSQGAQQPVSLNARTFSRQVSHLLLETCKLLLLIRAHFGQLQAKWLEGILWWTGRLQGILPKTVIFEAALLRNVMRIFRAILFDLPLSPAMKKSPPAPTELMWPFLSLPGIDSFVSLARETAP
jgi:hypothetical protein